MEVERNATKKENAIVELLKKTLVLALSIVITLILLSSIRDGDWLKFIIVITTVPFGLIIYGLLKTIWDHKE